MPEYPHLSVIIPARDAGATIGTQLEALAAQGWQGPWEVIVADNGSRDDTVARAEACRDRLPELRVVDASSVPGASHARNVAAETASGDYLLFLDADDIAEPGWLAAMAAAAAEHSFIAGVSTASHDSASDPRAGMGRTTKWSAILPSKGFLDAAATNNLGVSAEVWREVGGFRESMLASMDTAFCWDAQLRGHPLVRVDGAHVTYRMRTSLRELWRQQYRWGIGSVQLYVLFREHGAPRSSSLGGAVRMLGLVAMAPFSIWSVDRRRDWVGRAARRAGRIAGSIRFGVLEL
ncbi:glycosyl transferase [Agromyces luteolus]|uniref:Glycosyltransferase n=1 Tax=Agromyces luteolus TaxID=88373 RepID=A0A7C9HXB3_9MICO|nr:glycosyltransferase family 2 protein [Agromyces luteolus]MUN06400.1 glycosyltransferase [Agromyces luteolus]GLK26566.1 glycosyl transferase [Agromyces luteolus]